jgi:DNA damage-inducible protein 1
MQGRDVDLLFGLDMLKAHQACIDLEKNVLRISGREVRFLAEHELPDKARNMESGVVEQPSAAGPSTAQQPSFPGSGNLLGGNTDVAGPPGYQPQSLVAPPSRHSEEKIQTLMNLGVTREMAINTLNAANGNLDIAASMLF